MIKKISKTILSSLFLLLPIQNASAQFEAQKTPVNLLTLNCNILNEGGFSQAEFLPGDTAIFHLEVNAPNNDFYFDSSKQYRVDFNVSASATVKGFKIPYKFNEAFSAPLKNLDVALIKDQTVKLPSIPGKLILISNAHMTDNLKTPIKMGKCQKTLTIR